MSVMNFYKCFFHLILIYEIILLGLLLFLILKLTSGYTFYKLLSSCLWFDIFHISANYVTSSLELTSP